MRLVHAKWKLHELHDALQFLVDLACYKAYTEILQMETCYKVFHDRYYGKALILAVVEYNADVAAEDFPGMLNTYLLHKLLLGIVQFVHIVVYLVQCVSTIILLRWPKRANLPSFSLLVIMLTY